MSLRINGTINTNSVKVKGLLIPETNPPRALVWMLFIVKGIIRTEMKIASLFSLPRVILNCTASFFHGK